MARKIFYHRRSRRRALAAAGFALSALVFFSAGLYAGHNLALLVNTAQASATTGGMTERTAALAAAEF